MNTLALAVQHLLACGASHDAVVRFIDEAEASRKAKGTERVRKHRNACNVTDVTDQDLSPTPPIDTNKLNISPRGCRGNGTNPRALGTNPRNAPCPWLPSFDQFYEVYPRKKAKGNAKKAFKNALARATAEELLAGVKRYAAECVGREAQFIKMPASWLNADCWLDEPDRKPGANVVGFRKEFKPEPECPRVTEEERQANLAKLATIKWGTKKL
jgi:hypothetical protein